MTKRILTCLAALSVVIGLSACGGQSSTMNAAPQPVVKPSLQGNFALKGDLSVSVSFSNGVWTSQSSDDSSDGDSSPLHGLYEFANKPARDGNPIITLNRQVDSKTIPSAKTCSTSNQKQCIFKERTNWQKNVKCGTIFRPDATGKLQRVLIGPDNYDCNQENSDDIMKYDTSKTTGLVIDQFEVKWNSDKTQFQLIPIIPKGAQVNLEEGGYSASCLWGSGDQGGSESCQINTKTHNFEDVGYATFIAR